MNKVLMGAAIVLAAMCALLGWHCGRVTSELEACRVRVAILQAGIDELLAVMDAQTKALDIIKADAAAQSERLNKAQAQAAINRAASEVRVREILISPAPDDTHELVAWAVLEAQKLNLGDRGLGAAK